MKDEEYVFYQDIKEKKSIGRGAFHKKGGSKSKKCTLPSDYLTKKEREKMNGEVKTWSMSKFYTWEEFKEMHDDIQEAYVTTLLSKYNISIRTIGHVLWKKADATVFTYLKRKEWYSRLKKKGVKCSKAALNAFFAAIDADRAVKEDSPVVFIPNGMAPGYCSDGTKVEDAIKEAVDKANKKLVEDASVPVDEVIADLKKELGVPTPRSNDEEPLKSEYEEVAPVKAHIGYMELSLDRFDVDIFNQLAGMFEGDDVTVHIRVQRKIEDTCCIPVR